MIQQLQSLLENNNSILITTHKSPDGDAIGSSVAWYEFVKNLGKKAFILIPDEPSASLLPFLSEIDYLIYDKNEEQVNALLNDYQLLFCLDYNMETTNLTNDLEFNRFGWIAVILLVVGCLGGLTVGMGAIESTAA